MYRYYCITHYPIISMPRPARCINMHSFGTRRYVPEIDSMAWGWVEYMEELYMREVADYGLVMHPREGE